MLLYKRFDTLFLLSLFSPVDETLCVPLVFVPLFVFLFSIYSLALMKVTMDPHQVAPLHCILSVFNTVVVLMIICQ